MALLTGSVDVWLLSCRKASQSPKWLDNQINAIMVVMLGFERADSNEAVNPRKLAFCHTIPRSSMMCGTASAWHLDYKKAPLLHPPLYL